MSNYVLRLKVSDKWVERFLNMAALVATWSKDESTKVGCVLADSTNRIISVRFNGPPAGVCDAPRERASRLRRTIHAESNALHFAHRDVAGSTAYVTHPPCAHCTAHLIQRGVARIFYAPGSPEFEERWKDDLHESQCMCGDRGTHLIAVEGFV